MKTGETDSMVKNLDLNDFKNLTATSTEYYVLDFWADWCSPCKVMSPVFEEISKNTELQELFKFAKIDTDKNQELVELFGFRTIPSFFVVKFNADSKFSKEINIIESLGGSQTGLDLLQKLNKLKIKLL